MIVGELTRKILNKTYLRRLLLHALSTYEQKELLGIVSSGYLWEMGWFRSRKEGECVDKNGSPVPWLTYPFMEFITSRLNKDITMLEYGAGCSTLYWATSLKSVLSIEGDREWFDKLGPGLPENVLLAHHSPNNEAYLNPPECQGEAFDLVLLDGRRRNECMKNALAYLKPSGVVIVDNTERPEYEEGCQYLKENSFRRLDFWGAVPLVTSRHCTSLFYRPCNVLGI